MKAFASWLLASYLAGVGLASSDALVYLFPVRRNPLASRPPSITPNVARLLFAQRLGVSQFHSLGEADESTLKILNEFGGDESSLFRSNGDGGSYDKYLYVVEGVEHPEDIIESQESSMKIKDAPSRSHNENLVNDLIAQTQHVARRGSSIHIQHLTQLQGLSRKDKSYDAALHSVNSLFRPLLSQPSSTSVTIVLMPLRTVSSYKQNTKISPYGIYTLPPHKSFHQKREQEEPLEIPSPSNSIGPFVIAQQDSSDSDSDSNATKPTFSPVPLPKGILKLCHTSEEAAINATNNCSSHGTIYLRARSASKATPDACYACRCGSTTHEDPKTGNKKTVHWGGPACQKKDVSSPFWLLAGATLGLIGFVSFGIGLLFSVGNEDLPSVIGAGVAGPTAGK